MLINFSNHPSDRWSAEQKEYSLEKYGEIVDFPFPAVSVYATEQDIKELSEECVSKILEMFGDNPDTVMCQGEFTLSYAIIHRLIEKNIHVVAAIAERNTVEKIIDNKVTKISEFIFRGFREYQ